MQKIPLKYPSRPTSKKNPLKVIPFPTYKVHRSSTEAKKFPYRTTAGNGRKIPFSRTDESGRLSQSTKFSGFTLVWKIQLLLVFESVCVLYFLSPVYKDLSQFKIVLSAWQVFEVSGGQHQRISCLFLKMFKLSASLHSTTLP